MCVVEYTTDDGVLNNEGGYYLKSKGNCVKCEEGMKCEAKNMTSTSGFSLDKLDLDAGYYRFDKTSDQIYACPYEVGSYLRRIVSG